MALLQIGYDNLLRRGTLSASSESSEEFAKANAVDYGTWSAWKPQSGTQHWLASDLGFPASADFAAVYGLKLVGGQVLEVQSSVDGSIWTTRSSATGSICTGGPVWLPFTGVNARHWRLRLSDALPFQPSIGVAMIGAQLLTQTGLHVGFSEPTLAREVDALNLTSEGGTLLGRTVLNRGYQMQIQLDHLTTEWVNMVWLPFIQHAEQAPFFLCWPPVTGIPGISLFAWADGQIP